MRTATRFACSYELCCILLGSLRIMWCSLGEGLLYGEVLHQRPAVVFVPGT